MPSLIPGFEYDIFISYRQKDNKYDGWVTEFVANLKKELEATFKEDISIYFDENPHDGLLETHNVDKSLEGKLKCPIFIAILSQTYCDPKSFAWNDELIAFRNMATADQFGLNVKLINGNVASRILPIRIHQLDSQDQVLFEKETGGALRAIEFIYKEPGVNRPLRPKDDNLIKDTRQVFYRDNVNKVANAIKEILAAIKPKVGDENIPAETQTTNNPKSSFLAELQRRSIIPASLVYITLSLLLWKITDLLIDFFEVSQTLLSFVTTLLVTLFPLAMILAWMFERSPSGFVRYGTSAAINNPFSSYQRKPLTGNLFILLLLIAILTISFFTPMQDQSGTSLHAIRLSVMLEDEPSEVAISPDGLKIVFSLNLKDKPIFLRNLNESFSTPLSGTDGGTDPFFSPDGGMIGFYEGNSIYKTSLRNSQPVKIADAVTIRGAFWTPGDSILFSSELGSKLNRVSAAGGTVVPIRLPGQNFSRPALIPGTDFIIGSDENYNVLVMSASQATSKLIMPNGGWCPKYIEPGYLLYATQGKLFAAPFDKKRLQVTGASVPVIGKLKTEGLTYNGIFDISSNGTLIYSTATPRDEAKFVWVDEAGVVVDSLALPSDFYGAFSLSPDGTKLAYGINGPTSDIYIFDLQSGQKRKLTQEGVNQYPVWSPDGIWLTYSSLTGDRWDIYRKNLNSTSEREQLTTTGSVKRPGNWSPDGKLLTYGQDVSGQGSNTFLLSLEDKRVTSPWHNTTASDFQPRFSPNGNYVCYYSNHSGTSEVYVEPFPPTGERWQVSDGGVDAIWSPDGQLLYYRAQVANGPGFFYSVKLNTTKGFSFSPPKFLFSGPYVDVFDKSFNVAVDGKKFLVLQSVNTKERVRHFEVVINWVEELKRIMKKQE